MNDLPLIEAYRSVLQRRCVSVDELIATPAYREAFLAAARASVGDLSERDLLIRLLSLRKRSKLPRATDPILPPPTA
jgi:hypothetical protein